MPVGSAMRADAEDGRPHVAPGLPTQYDVATGTPAPSRRIPVIASFIVLGIVAVGLVFYPWPRGSHISHDPWDGGAEGEL